MKSTVIGIMPLWALMRILRQTRNGRHSSFSKESWNIWLNFTAIQVVRQQFLLEWMVATESQKGISFLGGRREALG